MPAFELLPVAAKAIVCFGDSITFMAASRADRGYPSILDELLFDQGVSVGNYGISGGTVQHAQDAYTLRHKDRGLWGACLLVGVNDVAAGATSAAVFAAINALVQEMLEDGLRVVVSTILPWKNGSGWTAPIQTITEAINAQILALDGTHLQLRVIDGYAELGDIDDPTLLQRAFQEVTADALHLGSYGAQVFARLVLPEIEELIAGDIAAPTGALNPAEDIANFLDEKDADGVTLELAENLFIGFMRRADSTPSPSVFVLNTGGPPPVPFLNGNRESAMRCTVQVMVRSEVNDFAAGEAMARSLFNWLHLEDIEGYYACYCRDSQPAFLGEDSDGHYQWSLNFELQYNATIVSGGGGN